MPCTPAVLHYRDLIANAFGIASDIYAFDSDEYFAIWWACRRLVICGRGGKMMSMPCRIIPFSVISKIKSFVYGGECTCPKAVNELVVWCYGGNGVREVIYLSENLFLLFPW